MPISLSICLSISLFVCLSVCPSSICLFVCLSVCLCCSLYVWCVSETSATCPTCVHYVTWLRHVRVRAGISSSDEFQYWRFAKLSANVCKSHRRVSQFSSLSLSLSLSLFRQIARQPSLRLLRMARYSNINAGYMESLVGSWMNIPRFVHIYRHIVAN